MIKIFTLIIAVIALLYLFRKNKIMKKIIIIISIITLIFTALYILKNGWLMKIEMIGLDCDCGTAYVYSNNLIVYVPSSGSILVPTTTKIYKLKANMSSKELYNYLNKQDNDSKISLTGYHLSLKQEHNSAKVIGLDFKNENIKDFSNQISNIFNDNIEDSE